MDGRDIRSEHATRYADNRIDDLHREGVNARLIEREKVTAEQDGCLPRQIERHRHQTIAPGIGPHHRQYVLLGVHGLMAIFLQQFIKTMYAQQIVLTERTHDKTTGKISDAKAQDAEARHKADDSRRQEYTFRDDIGFILAEYIADARQDNRIIANVEIDERRDDVEPLCRIDLPGKVLCSNPLDVDRPQRGHNERSRQSDAEIQPSTSGQHTAN